MRSLNTVEDRVLSILKKNKEARDDDMRTPTISHSSIIIPTIQARQKR